MDTTYLDRNNSVETLLLKFKINHVSRDDLHILETLLFRLLINIDLLRPGV